MNDNKNDDKNITLGTPIHKPVDLTDLKTIEGIVHDMNTGTINNTNEKGKNHQEKVDNAVNDLYPVLKENPPEKDN